jgi:hypothetical protein
MHKSILSALCRLIVLGMKTIWIYGCDMNGVTNFCPRTGVAIPIPEKEPDYWKTRWKNEEKLLSRIQREAFEHGVEIRRVETDG